MFLRLNSKKTSQQSLSDMPDEKLVSVYLENGDKELIAVLFERYTHLVYGICLNYLSDTDQCKDAVMDIFESLFHKLAEHKIQNFRNWLYSVTRNHCLMSIRKTGSLNRVKGKIMAEESESEFPVSTDDEDLMFSKAMIQSAVNNLNQEQGTCIRLMYVEDKSYREISDITGFGLNEVKSHIQNGKRNLKNYLLRQNGTTEI